MSKRSVNLLILVLVIVIAEVILYFMRGTFLTTESIFVLVFATIGAVKILMSK